MTRSGILVGVACAGLLAGVAWSGYYFQRQRTAAAAEHSSLAECGRLAGDIERLRVRPALASDQERLETETTRMIEAAVQSAGMDKSRLVRIEPAPPSRVGETPYKQKPTLVRLRNVRMEQIVSFVHELAGGGHGLTTKSIRISAPRRQETGGLWTAEITFVYLIYDPPKTK